MSASELDHHSEALVIREEVLLRRERLPSDLNLQRRPDLNVPNPVSGVTPTRADDCFVGFRVPRQGHRDSGARLAGLPSRVDEHQERVSQEPAPSPSVQRQRQPEDRQSETPWLLANAEERLGFRADWVGCDGSPDCRQCRILGLTVWRQEEICVVAVKNRGRVHRGVSDRRADRIQGQERRHAPDDIPGKW